jgi:hypothetical protein
MASKTSVTCAAVLFINIQCQFNIVKTIQQTFTRENITKWKNGSDGTMFHYCCPPPCWKVQYSQRHTMINHCDRPITHLGDLDISFLLINIFSKFLLHLECYLLSPKRHIKIGM